jgi:cell wall-associated NlpC family hydrolase
VLKALGAAAALALGTPIALAAVVSGPTAIASAPSSAAVAEIPADLLPVYVTAATTCPGMPWQVLAGIGFVESHHAGGHADPTTGEVTPPIIGPPIDGRPGFAAIPDSASPDGWAHAVGPMQFLTTTFAAWGVVAPDRPPGATPSPNNAWDAIFTAARYLCSGAEQLEDVRSAILRYNHSDAYADRVLEKALEYGLGGPPPSDRVAGAAGAGDAAVAAALTQLGVPYVWGGETPGLGFDCSGLVQWAYAQAGVSLPRTTFGQIDIGMAVPLDELLPGDLVFSRSVRGGQVVDMGHVAIYAGAGQVIVAPRTGDVVSVRPLDPSRVQATRRIAG